MLDNCCSSDFLIKVGEAFSHRHQFINKIDAGSRNSGKVHQYNERAKLQDNVNNVKQYT